MAHAVTLIPGDWIGPEITEMALDVIDAAGVEIDWDVRRIGPGGIDADLLESCRRTGVVLKAKVAANHEAGELPPTIALRKALGLWATVRPVKALPLYQARFPDMDLVVIRETSEDIYSGFEHEVTEGVYEAVKVTTAAACERIARFAYEHALALGRKHVTVVHKSNIMKKSDGLFLRTAVEIGALYAGRVETREVIVDALCMRLVRRPTDFDVLLCANLFGDIVADLCSGLAGGISASPSISLGDGQVAMFENPHGTAPDLVGTGMANPIPMIRSANWMLRHLGEHAAADRIRAAVFSAVREGIRPVDIGGTDDCRTIRDAIIQRL